MSANEKTACILVFDGVEEIEALAPVDVLRRAGVAVTIAGAAGGGPVKGRNDIRILPDAAFAGLDLDSFDLFLLPGGPGVMPIADDPEWLERLRNRVGGNRLTAAICAAPKALANAGVLEEREATSHASVREFLPQPSSQAVARSGCVTTSQGAGTAIAFGLDLVEQLLGREKADEIAAAIHHA